jgi:hypothetical protein
VGVVGHATRAEERPCHLQSDVVACPPAACRLRPKLLRQYLRAQQGRARSLSRRCSEDTWEPRTNLQRDIPDIVAAYDAVFAQVPVVLASSSSAALHRICGRGFNASAPSLVERALVPADEMTDLVSKRRVWRQSKGYPPLKRNGSHDLPDDSMRKTLSDWTSLVRRITDTRDYLRLPSSDAKATSAPLQLG